VIAVVPVRAGRLALGAEEAVNEAGGRALLVGSQPAAAAEALGGAAADLRLLEAGELAVGRWASTLAPVLRDERVVLLPASADGRELAPRLAVVLGRTLHAPAVKVDEEGATLLRGGGLAMTLVRFDAPVVVTLQPGSRGVDPRWPAAPVAEELSLEAVEAHDARAVETIEPHPSTVDLADASRIAAGGAGLGSAAAMGELARVAGALGCATGATRVVADLGWVPFERQIGTTGVVVSPELYLAFGVSGAAQHVSGIGSPRHVVSVNRDPACPMMAMADLAVVADAPAVVAALAERLGLAAEKKKEGRRDEADDPGGHRG
jgi:electron transfer flavoprotein alpha subunit